MSHITLQHHQDRHQALELLEYFMCYFLSLNLSPYLQSVSKNFDLLRLSPVHQVVKLKTSVTCLFLLFHIALFSTLFFNL